MITASVWKVSRKATARNRLKSLKILQSCLKTLMSLILRRCIVDLIESMVTVMIKNVNLKPFTNVQAFPAYVYKKGVNIYTLNATVTGGYEITLARITLGDSMSGGLPLSHVLFESYTKQGQKRIETKTRVGGYEREFNAAKQAMLKAGIEFEPIAPCHLEELLKALGAWYKAANPDIQEYVVLSQRCH